MFHQILVSGSAVLYCLFTNQGSLLSANAHLRSSMSNWVWFFEFVFKEEDRREFSDFYEDFKEEI